jgi:hypothetical protein
MRTKNWTGRNGSGYSRNGKAFMSREEINDIKRAQEIMNSVKKRKAARIKKAK